MKFNLSVRFNSFSSGSGRACSSLGPCVAVRLFPLVAGRVLAHSYPSYLVSELRLSSWPKLPLNPNTTQSAQTQFHPTKNPSFKPCNHHPSSMSSSMTLEEKIEALTKNFEYLLAKNEEKEAQNDYLLRQLDAFKKEKRRNLRSSSSSKRLGSTRVRREEVEPLSDGSSNEGDSLRFSRREPRQAINFNNFKVDIPKFEGKPDSDDFLEWMQTVERIFEYKEVPEDQKVKLVALKLGKYASLWWTNLLAKRVRQGKSKIRTWEKMKAKLKDRFLPQNYIQNNYSLLHHLTQGSMNVEEYTREFEKLLIKCDLQEAEEQTIVRYLGGLDPKYAHVVELQTYSTFDEVCVLAHKVETQMKSRPFKRDFAKPLPKGQPFNKGSPSFPPKPANPSPSFPQKSQAPQRNQPPQN